MNESMITALVQNGGAIATVIIFIWYLIKKDKMNEKTFDGFTKIIANHLQHATKAENKIARNLQKLSDSIENLNNKK